MLEPLPGIHKTLGLICSTTHKKGKDDIKFTFVSENMVIYNKVSLKRFESALIVLLINFAKLNFKIEILAYNIAMCML